MKTTIQRFLTPLPLLGDAKNVIHSTLLDSQWIAATGGDGWMRIVEFHEAGRAVYKTCSPCLDQWNRGPGFEFEIPAVPAGKKAR